MSGPFGLSLQIFSCVSLSGLLLLEWIALRTLTQETLVLTHLYEPTPGPEDAVLGILVKPFRAPLLDCSDVLTDRDLLGRVTTLLFVLPAASQTESVFSPALHSIWEKRRGPVYVVCGGSMEDCQLLRDTYRLGKTHNSSIDVVFDEGGALRMKLSVTSVLSAVVIDENGRVSKVGAPHSDEFIEASSGTRS